MSKDQGSDRATGPASEGGVRVRWDDASMRSLYSNVCNVTGTREEIVLLFGVHQAWHSGVKEVTVQLQDRVILSPYAAKRMNLLLTRILREYESRYGTLQTEPGETTALQDLCPAADPRGRPPAAPTRPRLLPDGPLFRHAVGLPRPPNNSQPAALLSPRGSLTSKPDNLRTLDRRSPAPPAASPSGRSFMRLPSWLRRQSQSRNLDLNAQELRRLRKRRRRLSFESLEDRVAPSVNAIVDATNKLIVTTSGPGPDSITVAMSGTHVQVDGLRPEGRARPWLRTSPASRSPADRASTQST